MPPDALSGSFGGRRVVSRRGGGGGETPPERFVVVGLGNPLLCDDGVGIRAAGRLAPRLAGTGVDVLQSSWGGMRFIELLAGYDRAVIIDAIEWRRGPPGTVYRLTADEAIPTVRATSYHDLSLGAALALGRALDIPLPADIVFFAVEAQETRTFGESLTPAVEAALAQVVRLVEAQLMQWNAAGGEPCTKPVSHST
jgi:hydrogenase maturation protease